MPGWAIDPGLKKKNIKACSTRKGDSFDVFFSTAQY
jgi:hypothetical protein